jgi:hypothetical protein
MAADTPFGWCGMESSNNRITYTPHPGDTAGAEADVLARVFRFVLFKSSASKGDRSLNSGPDDAKGRSHDNSRITSILPQ